MSVTTSVVDLPDRDNKTALVAKEEGAYDAGAFEEVALEVGVVRLLKNEELNRKSTSQVKSSQVSTLHTNTK